MAKRYVDVEWALRQVPAAARAKLRAWLERQPEVPRLVGTTKAAEMLGVHKTHVSRLARKGQMPEPIEVEGGGPAYLYEDIVQMKKENR